MKKSAKPVSNPWSFPFKNTESEKIVIFSPALNSSGDIYHSLALVILLKYYQHPIPKILLAYDREPLPADKLKSNNINTGNQVDRSLNFVSDLGYQEPFEKIHTKGSTDRQQKTREARIKQLLKEHYKDNIHLDQRASTTILSEAFLALGFEETSKILREGFSRRSDAFQKNYAKIVNDYVSESLKTIETCVTPVTEFPKQPLIIFHSLFL